MKCHASICVIAASALVLLCSNAEAQKRHSSTTTRAVVQRLVTNCPASGLTNAEIADILAAHNNQRQKVHTAPIVWDCALGTAAASWAAKGIFGHSGTSFGENIFVSSDAGANVSKAPDAWEDEEHHWNNKTGTCDSGKICTHYTQMVWRSTTKIGCAANRKAPGNWKLIIVCNYDPAAQTGPAF